MNKKLSRERLRHLYLHIDSIEFDCQGFNATIKILPPADQVVQKQTPL